MVRDILKGEVRVKCLRFREPGNLEERKELEVKESFVFSKYVGFNFLKPKFDVTENLGPKFGNQG